MRVGTSGDQLARQAADLRGRGRRLAADRRWWDAACATGQAARTYRRLAGRDPVYLPLLAATRVELAGWLSELGWADEAAHQAGAGAAQWRNIAAVDASRALDLATALAAVATYEVAVEEWSRARAAAHEAVDLYDRLAAGALPVPDGRADVLGPGRAGARRLLDRAELASSRSVPPLGLLLPVAAVACAALFAAYATGFARGPWADAGLLLGGGLAALSGVVPLRLLAPDRDLGPAGRFNKRGYAWIAGLAASTVGWHAAPDAWPRDVGLALAGIGAVVMCVRFVQTRWAYRSLP